MLEIKKIVFGGFQENTYLIWDDISKETAVVDPGCISEQEEKLLESFITDNNLVVKYLIATHCHLDHVAGCAFLKEKYNPEYYIPEEDLPLHQNAAQQASAFRIQMKNPPDPDKYITEETVLLLGNSKLEFIHTPGHTPGGYCIYMREENKCITADTLFNDSIGRTDLWGGDYETLIKSIDNKLFVLPDNTEIYPGHGDKSTIGREKKENPFFGKSHK
jgi:glyoxylase-like metal-dependent hydrolase (beta-lactamase superfamily II)